MRTLGVVTVARSDYGIYRSLLEKILKDRTLRLRLYVSGAHLSPEFGLTIRDIEKDGFEITERVETILSSDTPEGVAQSIAMGVRGFGHVFAEEKPDILTVLGDRFDMLAAVVASLPFNIPVAHIHGGESTIGAIDEQIRHAITKMSHLHFVSTETYAQRVIQMGEEPWRVTVSGAPGLDNLKNLRWLDRRALERQHGIQVTPPVLLVTYHPATQEPQKTESRIQELLTALSTTKANLVFTYPGADASSRLIIDRIKKFVARRKNSWLLSHLGTQSYFSLMKVATAMVGNSSSGIIEAASLKLPVVNIGLRQGGRVRGRNVIDTGDSSREISRGIERALSPMFRKSLTGLTNLYGDGHAAEKILRVLKTANLGTRLTMKQFHDISPRPRHA